MNSLRVRSAAPAMLVLCLYAGVAGCQSHKQAALQAMSDTQDETDGGATRASASQNSSALRVVSLPDGSGMSATQVAVPRGWHVEGRMIENPCINLPSPAWNAVSADGRSQFEVLPVYGWRYGNGRQFGSGCIPINKPMPASDFLREFASRLPGGVQVSGTMPVAENFRSREEHFTDGQNSNNAHLMPALQSRSVGDVAAVRATDATGHDLRLRAWVQCRERSQGGNCFAKVDVLQASKGQLDRLIALIDGHNLVQDQPTQQWQTAYMNHQQQVAGQQMDHLRRNAAAGSQMLHDQYVSSSATLSAEHEAGMQQLQSSTDSSMRNAQASQNARTTAASDMQDYSLERQTVSGANGTYKTSSLYSNVWSSPVGPALSDGRTFGSTDNTIDPNTATDNTWTKDTKVHGNGQPY